MANVSKLYRKEIYDKFSYLATWLPDTKIQLGDVGIQEGEKFKLITTLDNLGVPFKVRTGTESIDFTYTSQSGVTIKTKLAGQMSPGMSLPQAQAGVSMQFSKEGAFLFQASGCEVDEIEDKITLGNAVVKLSKENNWDPSWTIVDSVVHAKYATIIVSISGNASIDLTANAPLNLANLADVNVGLSMNSQEGQIMHFIAAKGLTPLFTLSRAKRSLIEILMGTPVRLRGATFGAAIEDLFEVVTVE